MERLVASDQVCRALQARRIVEVGTSFGVSTIFLATAVRDNLHAATQAHQDDRSKPIVIGTEYEPAKARIARGHFAEAGLADLINLQLDRL